MTHHARKELEEHLKHALVYIARIFMQSIANFWKTSIAQQIITTTALLIVSLSINIYYEVVPRGNAIANIQATASVIITIFLLTFLINLIRAPFQLDREREESIDGLHIEISLLQQKTGNTVNQITESPKQEEELNPNIICVQGYKKGLTEDYHSIFREAESGNNIHCIGILAYFCNEPKPKQQISKLDYVQASIFYYDVPNNKLKLTIQKAIWVGAKGSIGFEVNDAQKLILGVFNEGANLQVLFKNSNSLTAYDSTNLGEVEGFNITVRLLAERQWMKAFKFELRSDKEFVYNIKYVGETEVPTHS